MFTLLATTEGDIQLTANLLQRNAIRSQWQKWPDGVVPYSVDWAFTEHERAYIGKAFEVYHGSTCVRFVPRTRGEPNYIHLVKGAGCSSAVGMVGGRQEVSLGDGCVYTGIILHELMHAVGFWHEQSREDRDDYVTVDYGNIDYANHYNFRRHSQQEDIDHLGMPYDCNSVMHYNAYAFAMVK